MNESGCELVNLVEQKNISLDRLIIVHDDIDIPLGKFKLQKNRGSAGHKGVDSIVSSLGTKDFWRLRVGVGRPKDVDGSEDYVLEKFSKEELLAIRAVVLLIVERLKIIDSR